MNAFPHECVSICICMCVHRYSKNETFVLGEQLARYTKDLTYLSCLMCILKGLSCQCSYMNMISPKRNEHCRKEFHYDSRLEKG